MCVCRNSLIDKTERNIDFEIGLSSGVSADFGCEPEIEVYREFRSEPLICE